MHDFSYDTNNFLLNGNPFNIYSGEIHYQRIPKEYWRHRLQMVKSMGLNTVAIYMFWNRHEPRPGEFDFSEINDVRTFVKIAHEVDLKVILRPGPYCCAEWDFGGLPIWLLKEPEIRVRCNDLKYLNAVKRYIIRWSKELVNLQITHNGPIIMVQVENEYGSYGRDKQYLTFIRNTLRESGINVPLFTCDGPGEDMLQAGTLPDILPTVNFGSMPKQNFEKLEKFRPHIPHLVAEYYSGWFTHWGNRKLHKTGIARRKIIIKDLEWMLQNNKSFNLYMVHGGTNFEFSAGANYFDKYKPDITSYDYGSPISEAGLPTYQYHDIRNLMQKYLKLNNSEKQNLPKIPSPANFIELPEIIFEKKASLFANLGNPRNNSQIHSMEYYDQWYGLILYRTKLTQAQSKNCLEIHDLHDYGYIFLDGQRIGTLDRNQNPPKIKIPSITKPEAVLDILVEPYGRVNYGAYLLDRKGITDYVSLNDRFILMDWQIFNIPLDNAYLASIKYSEESINGPGFYQGTFDLNEIGDMFLDLRPWRKGMVWINGKNLGRYWEIGPQQSLYVPGPWLTKGKNTIILMEILGPKNPKKLIQIVKKTMKISPKTIKLNKPSIQSLKLPTG